MLSSSFIILFGSLSNGCEQKKKSESGKVEVKKVTLVEVVDDVPPPSPNFTSRSKNLQDWLVSICEDKKPEKTIGNYNLGILESPGDRFIYLVGINKYDKGDTSYTRIEFEPSNLYFQLPKSEYKNLSGDQLLKRLTFQLKSFTSTEKFKTSFLAEADSIIFESSGETIWAR